MDDGLKKKMVNGSYPRIIMIIKKKIKEYQKFVKDNFEYVGENFTYEARSIHYSKKKEKKVFTGLVL